MSNPFFSVVIPAYNAEPFLKTALECVQAQTFKDYELIVVDNGSADQTYKIAKSFLEKSVIKHKILHVTPNAGIGPGRNLGIKNSTGKYVAFLDADDIWYPNKLEEVHNILVNHPDVSLVCHDEYLLVNGKKVGTMSYGPFTNNMHESLLFNGNCLSGTATTVSKEKLIEVGMFSDNLGFNGAEDYDLWLRLSKICKFHFLHKVLGEYRITDFCTSKNVEKQVQNQLNVVNYHFSRLDQTKKNQNLLKRRYSLAYFGAGWGLHRQGLFRESRLWYLKAIREYPLLFKSYLTFPLSLLRIRW